MTAKKKAAKKASGRRKRAKAPVATATTAAILGIPPARAKAKKAKSKKGDTGYKPIKVKPKWEKYYRTLVGLHDRLLNQMDELAKESAEQLQGYSLHMADSGTDNFDRDFALSLLSSDQDAVYEIEEALKRIEKGTYGVCELTGKSIPKARLEAIPWTRFTVDAQAQLEKDGALRQRRLGVLGSVDSTGSRSTAHEVDDDDDSVNKPATAKDKD
ncbi:MAG: General stress protein 16O [Verrucomicrobia subdivision 3 bacterium]|nr:General stress protein 16O [Limisphaerales bacterium]MCS1412302.1 General stress protein 16O [Limisphaerales bacterium]